MAATLTPRDVALSQRGGGLTGTRKLKATMVGTRNTEFLRLVERTEDAFCTNDESNVEEVRNILTDVRTQYDHVHMEAERKEAELTRLREAIRLADQTHGTGSDDFAKKAEIRNNLEKQKDDTEKAILEEQTKNKVYNHMRARIQKEQELLKEKLLSMEAHLQRKNSESSRKVNQQERLNRKGAQSALDLDILEADIQHEKAVREEALKNMEAAKEAKANAERRRKKFEEWREEVAKNAANEAFNASAGRLRKIWAIEKLAGNCLQKITFEQVERSQNTEDGFQKIREVTGLADVMDIVHKFLNRDVEHEQLRGTVKEAEVRLEALREQFEGCKRDTDVLTFDDPTGRTRDIYLEVEEHESQLNQALKEHEQSRQRLQASTLQVEHMKRWANRMGRALHQFEQDCTRVDKPHDLPVYYKQMQGAVDKFIAHIMQQIASGKVQRKNMSQVASKEYHEARRLLADKDFLKANCRVPPSLDAGRPASRQGQQGTEEESHDSHQQERERLKKESEARLNGGIKKDAQQKKKGANK